MTTLTVHIENEKSEKAVVAVLEALGVKYELAAGHAFPDHVIAGVRKAQEDVKAGRTKEYEGLRALISR